MHVPSYGKSVILCWSYQRLRSVSLNVAEHEDERE